MLLLATRPQNYESLSLTNSTEFGQHSLSSSVELAGNQMNHIINTHKRPAVLAGAKPYANNVSSNFLANQIGGGLSNSKEKDGRGQEEKDWKLPYQSNNTILEDLKEEDISFATSNYRKDSNSRIHSQNESKSKIERQGSGNNSSEVGRESAPKSDLSGNANSKMSA